MKYKDLPSFNTAFSDVESDLEKKQLAIFLDYDGTLTPIVSRPENAILSEEMRNSIRELAKQCTVAIISGRDRQDVADLVGLEELIYSGSHGFDITGPDFDMKHESARQCLPEFEKAEKELKESLTGIDGSKVERKLFAIAVHYRNVADEDLALVEEKVDKIYKEYSCFKKAGGKKIIELKPDIDWHKGKALLWLLDKLNLNKPGVLPIYIGDDFTDEDAFDAIREKNGIGILVGDHGEKTSANYKLEDPTEVKAFLNKLIKLLQDKR